MDAVTVHKALGHSQRYALFLDLLQGGGGACSDQLASEEEACCVVDLTARHSLAQSTISHHLGILMDAGLIVQRRQGTYSWYRVNSATWEAFRQSVMTLAVCCSQDEKGAAFRVSVE